MEKTAIEYDGSQTKHTERRFRGQFLYADPNGSRLTLDCEELRVFEEGDVHPVDAAIGLPDPGTEAAHLLLAALLTAMDMQDDYEVVKKPQP